METLLPCLLIWTTVEQASWQSSVHADIFFIEFAAIPPLSLQLRGGIAASCIIVVVLAFSLCESFFTFTESKNCVVKNIH